MMRGFGLLAFAATLGCSAILAAQPASAELRALLIGVSDYDDATGIADLRGPRNDVRLLAETLRERGADDIAIVADGVGDGTIPTRAAILSAFEALRDRSTAGDLVYVHMSGHGTRQRDMDGDETDGWDEVFLPADAAKADRGSGQIPNALIDEEIGEAVDAIRRTGADVWFVLDSCHSGSGLRAAETGVASRFVDPAVLGIEASGAVTDDAPGPEPEGGFAEHRPQAEPGGGLLAFYSAQSSEVAREIDFAGSGADEDWYGLFSAKLAARMQSSATISYRQLFQAVMSDMATAAIPASARLQTPLWEGTFVDAPVFGGAAIDRVRQYAIDFDTVDAGTVHGLAVGTVVGLFADAAAGPEDRLGLAQVTETETLRAYVRPVGDDCRAQTGSLCAALGDLPSGARFARPIATPVDFTVRYSPVTDPETGEPLAADHPAARRLAAAIDAFGQGAAIDPADHDVVVSATTDGLRFSRSSGETGLSWRPEDGPLEAVFERIASAERLASALEAIAETASPFGGDSPIELSVAVAASPPEGLRPVRALTDREAIRRECIAIIRGGRLRAPVPLDEAGWAVKQCDQLAVTAQGLFPGARDVNRIHIDSRFCIHAAYARIEDFASGGLIGSPMVMCSDCPDGRSVGAERLYVVSAEARPNAEAFNLEGVVENCGGQTRSGAGSAALDYLAGLASGGPTRGAMGGFGGADVWVERFAWQVLPRAEALRRAGIAIDGE
ncbi:MAG: caspase family protein [Roseitalea porphyridii]|jgi:hypothetical protein|uniref:caspase family protein n=2 Tax=Roseitalea porphyridii TaxID=1852022 RepID=UPI0032EABE25